MNFLDYEQRLDRVAAWIHDHLDQELDLERLAGIAHLSPYHWHRIYRAMRGETVTATVKRLRLYRAAMLLAQTSLPVAEIAARSGYPNLQSFTRIFKASFAVPPAQYRKGGSHTLFQPQQREERKIVYDIRVETLRPMRAVTMAHRGSYMRIDRAFERLFGWLAARDRLPPDARMMAIFYDDVASVPEAELRSRAGLLTAQAIEIEAPLERTEIAGGDYAILRHKGPYADMKFAYDWLYGDWLPRSGREPGDAPCLEAYLNNPRETAPVDLLSDIYLPLRAPR